MVTTEEVINNLKTLDRKMVRSFLPTAVVELADRYQAPLSIRSCTDNYVWDGETIACQYSKGFYRTVFSDFDIVHEIAHWVVANKEERQYPEYGLALLDLKPYYANGFESKNKKVAHYSKARLDFRETCALILSAQWAKDYLHDQTASINLNFRKSFVRQDIMLSHTVSIVTKAVVWLKDRGLLSHSITNPINFNFPQIQTVRLSA